jgi:hypothetical protein
MKARKQLRTAAGAMIFIATVLFATVGWLTPTYLRFRAMHWDQMFRTAQMYQEFMTSLTAILYGVFPILAMMLIGFSITILKCRRYVHDDANAG